MGFWEMVLHGLVQAAEDRQQPVLDWLKSWERKGDGMTGVVYGGLRLTSNGDDRVEVEVNGEATVLLSYFQVERFKQLLVDSLA